jgi:enoyl-CoA hydratase
VSEYLLYEKDANRRVAWITFNRPEKLNTIGAEEAGDFARLPTLLRKIEADDEVKVLILRGAGEHFGVGADVMLLGPATVSFSRDPNAPRPTVRQRLLGERRMGHEPIAQLGLCLMFHFGKPCIAQVQGYCYGWHWQIAMGADICIASDDALFTHPAFRYIMEAWPMGVWMNTLGYQRCAELVFTGGPFTAQELKLAGMVNRVVPRDQLEAEVNEMADVIALMPLDVIVVAKHYLETLRAVRNDLVGPNMIGCMAHELSTFMKTEPGDFSVLRETTKSGAKGAIYAREARYPPKYRLGLKGRAAKE